MSIFLVRGCYFSNFIGFHLHSSPCLSCERCSTLCISMNFLLLASLCRWRWRNERYEFPKNKHLSLMLFVLLYSLFAMSKYWEILNLVFIYEFPFARFPMSARLDKWTFWAFRNNDYEVKYILFQTTIFYTRWVSLLIN